MRIATVLALLAVLCIVTIFAQASVNVTADPIQEVVHATAQNSGNSEIGFFGQLNSVEMVGKTTIYAKLNVDEVPEGLTFTQTSITFRRHHCNCFIAKGTFNPMTAEMQAFQFQAPIADDAMTFMGYIGYTIAPNKVIDIAQLKATLTFSVDEEGKTTPHAIPFTIDVGRAPFGIVVSASGPRQEVKKGEETETPLFPQLLLSGLTFPTAPGTTPTFIKFSPIGRFQYRLVDGAEKNEATCYVNGEKVVGTISGANAFETHAIFDISALKTIRTNGFSDFHCDADGALYPTNAVVHFKYDLNFFSLDLLDQNKAPFGLATFASLDNIPDVVPQTFKVYQSYQDDDLLLCKFNLNYEPAEYKPSKETDPTKANIVGANSVKFHFANIESDKINADATDPATASTLRVDVTPTQYREKHALDIPFNTTLIDTSVRFHTLSTEDLEFSTKHYANLTGGLSFTSFLPYSSAPEHPEAVSCAMVLTHPNGDKQWKGSGAYSASTSVRYFPSLAKDFKVHANLVTEKAAWNVTLSKLTVGANPEPRIFVVSTPAENWFFSGEVKDCTLSVTKGDKTVTKVGATYTEEGKTAGSNIIWEFNAEVAEDKPIIAAIVDDATITAACPKTKIVQKHTQFEFAHESTIVRASLIGANSSWSRSQLLDMKPSNKWVTIIFAIFITIMSLAALVMVICFTRCVYLKATQKPTDDQQTLLLNNGYSLE